MLNINEYVEYLKEKGYHAFALTNDSNPRGLSMILGELAFETGKDERLRIHIVHTSEIDFTDYGKPLDEGHIISTNKDNLRIIQILLENNGPFMLP